MLFDNYPVLIRGGGDLATGVAFRLNKSGFPIIVLELAHPLVIRRRVALATAVLEDEITVEGLHGLLVSDLEEALAMAAGGEIPVLVLPTLPLQTENEKQSLFSVIVDARMAKRNIDTTIEQAPLVIGLGPGFNAGLDCHAVIETMRGHNLGRAIWSGSPLSDTGKPGIVMGKGFERLLRSPIDGAIQWNFDIGEQISRGMVVGGVEDQPIYAPFDGVIRGLIAPGTIVSAGLKVGDVDPRNDVAACFTISDKALAVGGGVLEAILNWMNSNGMINE
jgi:xanthine dehydrogenase accessory factor